MGTESSNSRGPDLVRGVAFDDLTDGGMLAGHVGDERVLLARRGDVVFALGAVCTHYGPPLEGGLLVGDTVRCPWHHASFCLRTGEVLRAPALDPVSCWRVERRDGTVYVCERLARVEQPSIPAGPGDTRICGNRGGWSGRQCRRRDSSARRLLGSPHDVERRSIGPL